MSMKYLLLASLAAATAGLLAAPTAQATMPAAPSTASTTPATTPAPTTAPAKSAELAVTAADDAQTLKLGDNTAVAVSLAGNPTTGYSWTLTKIDGTALEQVGDIQYVADRVPAGMVGSGGTFVAHFRAAKAGQSTLTFGYARPWEKTTPPVKTFTVTIVVDKVP